MSIETAVHEILNDASIADAVALLALLPANRIVAGEGHNFDLPYANVSIESDLPEYRSNKGQIRAPRVRFQVWHDSHADGIAIRNAVETLFENKTFQTTLVRLETRHENSITMQEEDGTWQFMVDIETKLATIPKP